ncbi:MAG: transposase, partial [Exiguobacterium sp.]|nr:transposase [Exiguobacterium sp.]
RLRPQTVERSFADGKELHGLRFTFYRGIKKVQRANLVAATAQNMKKLANLLARKDCLHNISSILWEQNASRNRELQKRTNQVASCDLVRQQAETKKRRGAFLFTML